MTGEGPEGFYFDGRTAGRTPVRLEFGAASLRIAAAETGATLADWRYDRLVLLSETGAAERGLVGSADDDEARLAVADAAVYARLAGSARERHAAAARRHRRQTLGIAAATLAGAGALWLAWGPLADLAVRAIPRGWEGPIGRGAIAELVPEDKRCTGAEGQAALDGLVERLARPLGGTVAFHAQVMRSRAVNAFALPGGQIVILSGLIDKADSMDEVAGVLAHEMAHVVARHSLKLLLRESGLSLLVGLVVGNANVAGALSTVGTLAYSREFEAEADALGLTLLQAAGVRAGGLASFFRRMEKERGADPGILRYLASHPPPQERFERALKPAREGAAPMREAEWRDLRAICKEG
jgi:Zn-dependent protease with chaperone function